MRRFQSRLRSDNQAVRIGPWKVANLDVLGTLTLAGTNVTLELNGVTPATYDRFTTTAPVTLLSDVPLTDGVVCLRQ